MCFSSPPCCPGLLLTRHALRDRFFGGQFDKPGAKTGGVGYRNTVLRVYVDGEPTAAIEATIYNLHGFVFFCGADDANTTQGYDLASCTRQYGNSKLGKTAANKSMSRERLRCPGFLVIFDLKMTSTSTVSR